MSAQSKGLPYPIHLAREHEGPAPHTYVIWKKGTHCSHCGALHEWSELYAKTHLTSVWGKGRYVTNLRPLGHDKPRFNLPIELRCDDIKEIAFCHECPAPCQAVASLPFPPAEQQAKGVGEVLQSTDLVRNSPQHPDINPKRSVTKVAPKAKLSVDTLLGMIGDV